MKIYLENLLSEKKLDINHTFEVDGESGVNLIPLGVVIEHILITTEKEKSDIQKMLVKIDFHNGDVMHFFNHLSKAIAR